MTAYMYKFASGNTRLDSLIAGLVDELEKLGAGEPYLRRTGRPPDRSRARSAAPRPAPAPAPRQAPPPAPAPAPQQAQPAPQQTQPAPAPQQTQPAPTQAPQTAPVQQPPQQPATPKAKPGLIQEAVNKGKEQIYRAVSAPIFAQAGMIMGERMNQLLPDSITANMPAAGRFILPAAAAAGGVLINEGINKFGPMVARAGKNFLSTAGNSFMKFMRNDRSGGPSPIANRGAATQQAAPAPAPSQPNMQKIGAFRDYMFYKLAAKYDNLGDAIKAVKTKSKQVIPSLRLGLEIVKRMEKRVKDSDLDPRDKSIALEHAPKMQFERIMKRLDQSD